MTPQDALAGSIATMVDVLGEDPIPDDRLDDPTPCAAFTIAQLGDHIIETHELFLAGTGGAPLDLDGPLAARHAAVAAAALDRWTQRGIDGAIDLGGNDLPASFGISLHALEAFIHGWDLAQALGRRFEPPAELTDYMWEFAEAFISDDLRGDEDGAPYGPATPADENDNTLDRLIAHAGRDPRRPVAVPARPAP